MNAMWPVSLPGALLAVAEASKQLCEAASAGLGLQGYTMDIQLQLGPCALIVLGGLALCLVWISLRRLQGSPVFVLDFAVHKPHDR